MSFQTEVYSQSVSMISNVLGCWRLDCEGFRAGSEPEKYQLFSAGVYYNFTCQPPLVWSQERCSCQARPVVIEDPNCPHHRPYPGDETKYQARAHGVWVKNPISCPPNQVWNQTNCWCDYGEAKDPDSLLGRPGKYCVNIRMLNVINLHVLHKLFRHSFIVTCVKIRYTHLNVYLNYICLFKSVIQEQVTGPCFPIFNATFDHSIRDDSQFEFSVGREPWQAISTAPNMEGAHGGAARVQRGRMPLWFSGGNDFGGKLQIQIRFKVLEGSHKRNEDIIVLSNQNCSGGIQTIAMYYRPDGEKYSVFFRDREISRRIFCTSKSGVSC